MCFLARIEKHETCDGPCCGLVRNLPKTEIVFGAVMNHIEGTLYLTSRKPV